MSEHITQWHPGFCSAMKLELRNYKSELSFDVEHELNTKPIKVDLLIIKKSPDVKIDNEIGRIFKGHNIFEYKSPEDALNVDTFYNGIGYVALYKAYGDKVDVIKADDVTLSFVRESKPEKLFKWFKENNINFRSECDGIYYVDYMKPINMQIIVTKELKGEGHIWLKSLTENLTKEDSDKLIMNIALLTDKDDKECADSVIHVVSEKNKEIFYSQEEESMYEPIMKKFFPEMYEEMMEERKIIAEKDQVIATKDKALATKDKALAEKDAIIHELQMKLAIQG